MIGIENIYEWYVHLFHKNNIENYNKENDKNLKKENQRYSNIHDIY